MTKTRLMLIAVMLLVPAVAHGSTIPPCPAGLPFGTSSGYLEFPSCTIGNLTFSFIQRDTRGSTFKVAFAPDATNADGPGFILGTYGITGTFDSGFTPGDLFDISVSVTNPDSANIITGVTVITTGASAGGPKGDESAAAGIVLGLTGSQNPSCGAGVNAGATDFPPFLPAQATAFFGPDCIGTAASGQFAIGLDGANSTMTSAEFIINEANTPEPSSVLLFGTALVGMMGVMRRKVFCRS